MKLNEKVKAAELESEHIEQGMLEALLATKVTVRTRYGVHEALAANLQMLLKVSRISAEECVLETSMNAIIAAACAYCPSDSERMQTLIYGADFRLAGLTSSRDFELPPDKLLRGRLLRN